MRKKNWKTCLPFELEGDNDVDVVNNLPPLFVPSFRWWQCPTCVPENKAQRTTEDKMVVETGSDDHAATDSYQNVGDENGILNLHSKESTGKC